MSEIVDETYDINIPSEPPRGSVAIVEGVAWVNGGLKNMEWVSPMVQVQVTQAPKGQMDPMSAYASWEDLLRRGSVNVIFRGAKNRGA